jgi:hypothetical protein
MKRTSTNTLTSEYWRGTVGKSHALCAVGHALIETGHSVLFTPAYALVQELLSAKRDLQLPRALRKLDLFEVILLDDLGYVQQSPDEAEVLFTLLAERYERRSVTRLRHWHRRASYPILASDTSKRAWTGPASIDGWSPLCQARTPPMVARAKPG